MTTEITRISDCSLSEGDLKEYNINIEKEFNTMNLEVKFMPLEQSCPPSIIRCNCRSHGHKFRIIFYDKTGRNREPLAIDYWSSFRHMENSIKPGSYIAAKLINELTKNSFASYEALQGYGFSSDTSLMRKLFRNITILSNNLTQWFSVEELSIIRRLIRNYG